MIAVPWPRVTAAKAKAAVVKAAARDFLALIEWLRGLQLTALGSMGLRFALPGHLDVWIPILNLWFSFSQSLRDNKSFVALRQTTISLSDAVNGHKESVAKIDFEDLLQAIHCDR
jgi:hypothetical protein